MSLFDKCFLSGYYFTIAIKKRDKGLFFENGDFFSEKVYKANKNHWAADPMLIDDNGRTYMFYEAVDGQKGHIEVCEILDDCSFSEPRIILKDDCHYSYPFVFKIKDDWFMIPESSQAEEVRLYKASSFPYEWELDTILLEGPYVDSTVLMLDGRLWLVTFKVNGKTEHVVPLAFHIEFNNEGTKIVELNWDEYDPLRVRGAGAFQLLNQRILRPAQINEESRYGDGIAICDVSISDGKYSEQIIDTIYADKVHVKNYRVDGLHTYNASQRYECIDIRCREFELLKILKKCKRLLLK